MEDWINAYWEITCNGVRRYADQTVQRRPDLREQVEKERDEFLALPTPKDHWEQTERINLASDIQRRWINTLSL